MAGEAQAITEIGCPDCLRSRYRPGTTPQTRPHAFQFLITADRQLAHRSAALPGAIEQLHLHWRGFLVRSLFSGGVWSYRMPSSRMRFAGRKLENRIRPPARVPRKKPTARILSTNDRINSSPCISRRWQSAAEGRNVKLIAREPGAARVAV